MSYRPIDYEFGSPYDSFRFYIWAADGRTSADATQEITITYVNNPNTLTTSMKNMTITAGSVKTLLTVQIVDVDPESDMFVVELSVSGYFSKLGVSDATNKSIIQELLPLQTSTLQTTSSPKLRFKGTRKAVNEAMNQMIYYVPSRGGTDSIQIKVTDDADTPRETFATIYVTILEDPYLVTADTNIQLWIYVGYGGGALILSICFYMCCKQRIRDCCGSRRYQYIPNKH